MSRRVEGTQGDQNGTMPKQKTVVISSVGPQSLTRAPFELCMSSFKLGQCFPKPQTLRYLHMKLNKVGSDRSVPVKLADFSSNSRQLLGTL